MSQPLLTLNVFFLSRSHFRWVDFLAGVTIMALGALAANPDLDLKIVCCGLNYFHPHRFRSRAVVEFSEPLTVPPELVEMYKKGGPDKREACGKLLDTIYDTLKNVTLNAPDYETLMVSDLGTMPLEDQPCSVELALTSRGGSCFS
jgi:1-acyl-sn-glycerol-3-phosphate acyltransferase